MSKMHLPTAATALPGRAVAWPLTNRHAVNGRPLLGPWQPPLTSILLGMGCFWGAERRFWQTPGVWVTAVGYAGGFTANPTYAEVCTGQTGHAEVVCVVHDRQVLSLEDVLRLFWEGHDPTQGMRQGNDFGTPYRSAIYTRDEADLAVAQASCQRYQQALQAAGHTAAITTEIRQLTDFYPADDEHQQYLAKVPWGYCGHGGTGVRYPLPGVCG